MGLFESIKGLFGNKVNIDQLKDMADQNNDGKIDTADLSGVQDMADVNKDGQINQEDLNAAKDKLTGQM